MEVLGVERLAASFVRLRCGSMIRKAQNSPRVWICLSTTRGSQGHIKKKQGTRTSSRVLNSYTVVSIEFLIAPPSIMVPRGLWVPMYDPKDKLVDEQPPTAVSSSPVLIKFRSRRPYTGLCSPTVALQSALHSPV